MTYHKDLKEVRRQQAVEKNVVKEQRKRMLQRMDQAANKPDMESIKRHNAIVRGLIPRISGAIDSWVGHRVPMTVRHPTNAFAAYTDFVTITIEIPPQDVTIDFAADLRGLAYHEAGHVLVSVPFTVMLDVNMPLEANASEDAKLREKFVERLVGFDMETIHHTWNVLEDQRMESAMVEASKNLGRYYNVIVLTHVLSRGVSPTAYLLLYGRGHVDAAVRASARQAYVAASSEAEVIEIERLIDVYKYSEDLVEMWETVVAFAKLTEAHHWSSLFNSFDMHELGDPGDIPVMSPEQAAKRVERAVQGSRRAKDASSTGGGNTANPNPSAGPGQSDAPSTPDWNRSIVVDALDRGKDERNNDGQVLNDVKAYNLAMSESSRLPMPRIPTTPDPDPVSLTRATKINRSLRNLMEQVRAEQAPSWHQRQRRGVLDVKSYLTRQHGDMEFFRDYAPGGDMRLPNMAVSVVLDGSGSMDHAAQDLAVAAFGMKSACDVVGIPCTVSVYDTQAYLLWDQDDMPIEVPYNVVPCGGTDPKHALDLLDLQKADKENHLVIIMTDGAWGGQWRGQYSLAHYAAPDRDIVMFYYKCNPMNGPSGIEVCSTVTRIDDLDEIPKFLTRYITRCM